MSENQMATPQINHLLNLHLNAIINKIEVAVRENRRPSTKIMEEMMDRDLTVRDLKLMFGRHQ
ncbi:hypothetical protein DN068_13270 [Taibaiella soli]|uniref:Uncharacterized protein n=2 Tax=Taibaiella soli TaxID=1649169 RepID=A0A2W2AFN9_9BACT|nr:hypothetical protein DN068_13270 [Taibaiella soli]